MKVLVRYGKYETRLLQLSAMTFNRLFPEDFTGIPVFFCTEVNKVKPDYARLSPHVAIWPAPDLDVEVEVQATQSWLKGAGHR